MDYWAKYIYSWGIFSAEVYPRSSIEAHFLLSGHVNSKNNIFWGSTPPEHCLQRPLHSEVHCLGCHLQIWHHWTILVQGWQRAVCDNQHRVICPGAWQVLDSTWSTERGRQCPLVFPAGWCHPPNLKRIIGMATAAFPWPTDQPQVWPSVVAAFTGLEPPYFYMWGYLKDRVYSNNPQTIPDLKAAITAAIRAIPREECGRVIKSFARRIQMCLQRRGAHLEHIFEHLLSYLSTPGPGIGRLEWKPIRMLIKCVIDITQSSKMTGFFAWFFWILLLDLNHWFWFKSINPGSSSKYLVMYETAIICRRIGWLPVCCVRRTNEGWSRVGR